MEGTAGIGHFVKDLNPFSSNPDLSKLIIGPSVAFFHEVSINIVSSSNPGKCHACFAFPVDPLLYFDSAKVKF